MMKIIVVPMLTILSLSLNTASACQFNTDCDVGSKCIKRSGSLYGYCMGGMNPGNTYDRQPATDIRGGGGWTCSFNTDCDPGYVCAKSGLQGTCVKR
jgi:hypothetical protein